MNSTSLIAGLAIYHMPCMYEIYVYIPFEWMGCQWYACGRHHPCLHGELHGQLWVCASRHFCQTWILEIWWRWWIQLEDLAWALQLLMLKQWLLRLGFLETSTVSTSCIRIPMTSQTWWERIWKKEWKEIDSWQQKKCLQLFVSIYCISVEQCQKWRLKTGWIHSSLQINKCRLFFVWCNLKNCHASFLRVIK